mgnify:FL=1
MKQGYILLPGLALALTLAGCAGAARPLGEKQPDLVVYNDSTAIIGSITVSSDRESQGVAMADGSPLERGESYGFQVAETERVTVELWDLEQHSLGRCQVKMEEQPCGLRWMMNWA